jgi:DNA-binding transcriptional MerR regulator
MDKSPDAFRTISEVADVLETPAHVLRFWESRFPQIRPVKRAGGRRYYRPSDVALLAGIKRLLHDEGLTIRGVQRILKDQGVRHVAGLTSDSAVEVELAGTIDELDHEDVVVPGDVVDSADQRVVASVVPPKAPPAPTQPDLPLFAKVAGAQAPKALPRQPTYREDASFAGLIRALPAGALAGSAPEINALARRLAALRATMAARADGAQG